MAGGHYWDNENRNREITEQHCDLVNKLGTQSQFFILYVQIQIAGTLPLFCNATATGL